MSNHRIAALIIGVSALCLTGCGFSKSYYVSGAGTSRPILRQMFASLAEAHSNPKRRFLFMREIVKVMQARRHTRRLNLLLTDYVDRHPKDPYDAYYLYIVAEDYLKAKAVPFADVYFDRILERYPNLSINGKTIDYLALSELVKTTHNPYQRINYYKELLARFDTTVQKAPAYFKLAKSYGQVGEWKKEMQTYESFLQLPNHTVPGVPTARNQANYFVELYNYPHVNWAFSSLPRLVDSIRYAVDVHSVRLLSRYWAKVGFFARSWESLQAWDSGAQLLVPLFLRDFYVFMTPSVYVDPNPDITADNREAFLKTGGWSYRIPTWYFYFRKINFPANPSIQGKWEWAGVYFGQKALAEGMF